MFDWILEAEWKADLKAEFPSGRVLLALPSRKRATAFAEFSVPVAARHLAGGAFRLATEDERLSFRDQRALFRGRQKRPEKSAAGRR